MDIQKLQAYLSQQLVDIRKHYAIQFSSLFFSSLEGLVKNAQEEIGTALEIHQKVLRDTENQVGFIKKSQRRISVSMTNSTIRMNAMIVNNYIDTCKPSGVEVPHVDFSVFFVQE
ncbi:hypothetical protein A2914_01050 [Candidatus Nomurabacteria bacterium RIFCSPLOWO2_01_FULL_41_21]|uniref:Uncharacterized protein n=2 Tax=Candidatus Nomuraibacteriota TaxID=1752729 RepID=A0A1F6V242_9BACT|nr:MAG: hypothetical protein A2733_02140 [Candidatus Nomurabacteria bacterium RIFCSPHIGHO2_01_FULL_40_20]OGI87902.1 MAG: hypothetical protein A2914_01050 [Candidatus Nomurabacteria bacterium RIFCSPLOWO2_01_FULL_41_21]